MTLSVRVTALQPGDRILWGDRSEPLTVQDTAVHVDGAPDLAGVTVESQRGTTYVIHESVYGPPKAKRETTPSADNPSGLVSAGKATDLRLVEADA